MKEKIKIVIADDEHLFRSGISFLLQREDNIEILFEADNGLDVIEFLKKNSNNLPDIILMDLKCLFKTVSKQPKSYTNIIPK